MHNPEHLAEHICFCSDKCQKRQINHILNEINFISYLNKNETKHTTETSHQQGTNGCTVTPTWLEKKSLGCRTPFRLTLQAGAGHCSPHPLTWGALLSVVHYRASWAVLPGMLDSTTSLLAPVKPRSSLIHYIKKNTTKSMKNRYKNYD